ncbi:hypothetical protein LBMAG53_29280 [Planctomycetota bacterium]|nr:hypothetical protein LBMAG53_29280 [Planctomycetota bacterium]
MVRLLLLLSATAVVWSLDTAAIPADHRWALQFDVRQIMAGRVGRWIDRLAERPDLRPKLALFTTVTGSDPRKDLHLVTFSGRDARPESGVLAITGRLDREKLTTLVESADGHHATTYREHQVHDWKDAAKKPQAEQFGVICGVTMVVVANARDRLLAVLDVVDRASPALEPAKMPVGEHKDVTGKETMLVSGMAAGLDGWQGLTPEAAILRHIASATLALSERDGALVLRLRIEASSPRTAKQLASVVEGFISLSQLDPKTRTDPAWLAVIESASVELQGKSLSLSASLPIDLAEKHWSERIGKPAP